MDGRVVETYIETPGKGRPMSTDAERDLAEALAALQRLHRHGIVTPDEAREAARLITGDAALDFPPAAPAAAPAREATTSS